MTLSQGDFCRFSLASRPHPRQVSLLLTFHQGDFCRFPAGPSPLELLNHIKRVLEVAGFVRLTIQQVKNMRKQLRHSPARDAVNRQVRDAHQGTANIQVSPVQLWLVPEVRNDANKLTRFDRTATLQRVDVFCGVRDKLAHAAEAVVEVLLSRLELLRRSSGCPE